ncbi:MAG: ferredoxin--NADP reductase, partial [Terriglobia bacterium]
YIADTGLGTEVTMFFANRDAHEIPFRREFDGLAAANGNLKVVYVISRPDDGWGGHRGHIDAPLVKKEAPDYADRKFYVSGPPNMVHGMESVLKELGVADALIKRELFVGY